MTTYPLEEADHGGGETDKVQYRSGRHPNDRGKHAQAQAQTQGVRRKQAIQAHTTSKEPVNSGSPYRVLNSDCHFRYHYHYRFCSHDFRPG